MSKTETLFPWTQTWWRTGGGVRLINGVVRTTGGGFRTAANGSAADPFTGSEEYTLEIRYSAEAPVPMSRGYGQFKQQGGQGGSAGPDVKGEAYTLPATGGQVHTEYVPYPVTPYDQANSWRPILDFDAAIVIYEVAIYARPYDGGAQGSLTGFAGAAVASEPRSARLSVPSAQGDYALLFVASGGGDVPYRAPEGWTAEVTPRAGNTGRSGYVAWKKVESPSDTQNVNPWGPGEDSPSKIRDRAGLAVVRGGGAGFDVTIVPWAAEVPAEPAQDETVVVASQLHATANTEDTYLDTVGSHEYVAGGRDSRASWSSMHVMRVDGAVEMPQGATAPQAWAAVRLTPKQDAGPQGGIFVWDGQQEIPAGPLKAMPRGARTVAELLGGKGFVIAHRGGSASWTEHTLHAYTQAVAHGADALEVSCHKTTDGVWVASHDDDMHRITEDGRHVEVTKSTWDDLQGVKLKGGHPVMRIEELLEAYGQSHVLFVDPKQSAVSWRELVAKLDKERHVLKFSADAQWLADAWKAMGFTTWGYAYSTHALDGSLTKWQSSWSILGMEWNATPEAWQATLSHRKPAIAHIASNRAAYAAGLTAGATGVMVAGVADVLRESV